MRETIRAAQMHVPSLIAGIVLQEIGSERADPPISVRRCIAHSSLARYIDPVASEVSVPDPGSESSVTLSSFRIPADSTTRNPVPPDERRRFFTHR